MPTLLEDLGNEGVIGKIYRDQIHGYYLVNDLLETRKGVLRLSVTYNAMSRSSLDTNRVYLDAHLQDKRASKSLADKLILKGEFKI